VERHGQTVVEKKEIKTSGFFLHDEAAAEELQLQQQRSFGCSFLFSNSAVMDNGVHTYGTLAILLGTLNLVM
jgi:hypothetical protein